MSDAGEYTFEKAVANLQGIANSMADVAADINHDSRTRLIASALDVTIENLLFILKGASISWTPTLSDEDNERIQRVKAYGTGQGPRPFTDANTWQPPVDRLRYPRCYCDAEPVPHGPHSGLTFPNP